MHILSKTDIYNANRSYDLSLYTRPAVLEAVKSVMFYKIDMLIVVFFVANKIIDKIEKKSKRVYSSKKDLKLSQSV